MKTITVGALRQNPTPMLDDVETGAVYRITRHGREVGRVVPPHTVPGLIPPKKTGGARTSELTRVDPSGVGIDELIEDLKGDW